MWYRKQVKIQEVLTWQEFKHGTPYHVTLQASRPLDCCCKTSVMPLILKAQTLFFISHNHWVFHAAVSRWFIHLLEPDHQAAAGLEKTQLYQLSTTSRFWNPQCWAICINWYEFWVEVSPKLVNFGVHHMDHRNCKELLATRSKSIGSIPEDAEGAKSVNWRNSHF